MPMYLGKPSRNERKWILPYDSRVEYLESTGSQRIDTGVKVLDDDWTLELDFLVVTVPTTAWKRFMGSYVSEPTKCTRLINYSTTSDKMYAGYRRRAQSQNPITSPGYFDRWTWRLSYKKLEKAASDGTVQASWTLYDPDGAEDTSTVLIGPGEIRMWGFRAVHSGTVVRDMFPVRVGQVGYLYDRVTGGLFGNAGSGSFLLGADLG